jgi:hypothetical protein
VIPSQYNSRKKKLRFNLCIWFSDDRISLYEVSNIFFLKKKKKKKKIRLKRLNEDQDFYWSQNPGPYVVPVHVENQAHI